MNNSNLTFVPQSDYEFIGLSFDEHNETTPIHCSEFNLTIVQNGFTTQNIMPTFKDDLAVVDGRDAAYYFGTTYEPSEISITFAFDNLNAENYRKMKEWLNPKKIKKLIFDESPYKYYWAKTKSTPSISFIPFEEENIDGPQHIYKGTAQVTFQALDPFAYSDYLFLNQVIVFDGENWNTPYSSANRPGWFGNTNLLVSTTGYYTDATKDVGQSIASVSIGDFPNKFYNAGTEDVFPHLKFSFSSPQNSIEIKNLTNETSFKLNIADFEPKEWTIDFNPEVGACLGEYEESGAIKKVNLTKYLSNSLVFSSEDNQLNTDKSLANVKIKYKNKYL